MKPYPSKPFLILAGVSGAGKSTIIRELLQLDARFRYISPYTTRQLRPGEQEKVCKTTDEIAQLCEAGEIVYLNHIYGASYATPRQPIDSCLHNGDFPVLDFPIQKLSVLQAAYPQKIYVAYILPPSIDLLIARLADGRDPENARLQAALDELNAIENHRLTGYDLLVKNNQGLLVRTAYLIYRSFQYSNQRTIIQ